jgi:hypothetical protein
MGILVKGEWDELWDDTKQGGGAPAAHAGG